MTKYIPYLVYLWLIAFHQVIFRDVSAVFGSEINLPVLILLLVAMYKSEITVLWFGFLAGLIGYLGIFELYGWQVLLMTMLGLFTFHIKERMNLESLFARMTLLFCGVLFHNILNVFIELNGDYFFYLLAKAIPGAVYTSVIGYLFFLIKDDRLTYQKIKSIF